MGLYQNPLEIFDSIAQFVIRYFHAQQKFLQMSLADPRTYIWIGMAIIYNLINYLITKNTHD